MLTIFKTWHLNTNTYHYWVDMLPSHECYNLIIGQANVSSSIYKKHETKPLQDFLKACYEECGVKTK